MTANVDPRSKYPAPPFPEQSQKKQPGLTEKTNPHPDHGEDSYRGNGRLAGQRSLITGGDSGIGRAVAIAFAREGADIGLSYLGGKEEEDARGTAALIRDAGRKCVLLPGDIRKEDICQNLVDRAFSELGGIDTLVLNAGTQHKRPPNAAFSRDSIMDVFATNLLAPLLITREAAPRLHAGASIIVTASIQGFDPSPDLLDYAMTKAALVAFTKALAQEQGGRGIRVNAVAPGPIWTPLIPATGWTDKVIHFGEDTPLGRPGQPAEMAGAYVYLASQDASYTSGAVLSVTGGKPL